MNRLVRGKTSLILVSVAMMFLSLLLTAGSVGLVVWGALIVKSKLALGLVLIISGSLLSIMFLSGIIYGFVLYFTGKSLVALNGSVAEGNSVFGTANMKKCSKCGTKVEETDNFCPQCNNELTDARKCGKCGVLNKKESNNCTACGEKLK